MISCSQGGRNSGSCGLRSINADVEIVADKIVDSRLNRNIKRRADVDGLLAALPFIDPHTHLDAQLRWDPLGHHATFIT